MNRLALALPLVAFAVIIAIALAMLHATSSGKRDGASIGFSMTGQQTPQLVMPALDGGANIALTDMRGRAYAINVFASWCAPCKIEAPAIEAIAASLPVIGINYRDTAEDAAAFLSGFGNPYHAIAVDRDGAFGIRLGVHGLPETFIIGADGTIIHHHQGPVLAGALNGVIADAIAKAKQGANETAGQK